MSTELEILKSLESEAIEIFRETAATFRKPVLMYSIGKDSSVLLHLAKKAFYPAPIPFKLLHIDTTWKFKEMISFRDKVVADGNLSLIVHTNQEGVTNGTNPFTSGISEYTRIMKTVALRQALDLHEVDAAIGGSRRDEEKSRAKERVFSFRDKFGQWDPKNQRPELWNLFNGKKAPGESFRVFPISNWTEMDVWQYIKKENIALPSIYFAHDRSIVNRGGVLLAESPYNTLLPGEKYEQMHIRYRTLGCMTITGAIFSDADDLDKVIEEVAAARSTERGNRADDKRSEAAMEDRKKQGYF